jgi:hypothetical protein
MQVDAKDDPPFDCGISGMKNLFAPSRWHWPKSKYEAGLDLRISFLL